MNAQAKMTQIVLEKACGPGQVLVRVEAAGVAFNDVTARQGRNPGPLPRVLGFDVVGRVAASAVT